VSVSLSVEERLSALEARLEAVGPLLGVREERDHWIGEAKKFESWYRAGEERATRYSRELSALREEGAERVVELERLLDVVHEASRRVWPLIRSGADVQEVRDAVDWISRLARAKTLTAPDEGEGGQT
jgi:hypothetical protein